MLNKTTMLLVSGSIVAAGVIGTGVFKAVKKINDQKKKENAFFDILKECIEEEADFCINAGILHQSDKDRAVKKIFEDTVEFAKNNDDFNSVLELSPEEQRSQLKAGMESSHPMYAMYGFCA